MYTIADGAQEFHWSGVLIASRSKVHGSTAKRFLVRAWGAPGGSAGRRAGESRRAGLRGAPRAVGRPVFILIDCRVIFFAQSEIPDDCRMLFFAQSEIPTEGWTLQRCIFCTVRNSFPVRNQSETSPKPVRNASPKFAGPIFEYSKRRACATHFK